MQNITPKLGRKILKLIRIFYKVNLTNSLPKAQKLKLIKKGKFNLVAKGNYFKFVQGTLNQEK